MKTAHLTNWLQAALAAVLLLPCGRLLAQERKALDTHASEAALGLRRIERFAPTNRLHLAIGLPFRHAAAVSNLVRQLYTRGSPNFHRYLTPAQFAARFSPTEQDYQKVIDFAKASGLNVEKTARNRASLDVTGAVPDLEKAFHVTLGVYQHPTENRRFYGPDVEPTVDASLPVIFVSGLDNYVIPRPNSWPTAPPVANTNNGSGSRGTYLGYDFRKAYVPGTPMTGSGQKVGLVEFDGYTTGDIRQYEGLAGLPNVPLQNMLMGGFNGVPGAGNGEVALDIEMAIAMAPLLAGVNVYEAANSTSYDTTVLNEIVSPTQGEGLPEQISCSWGIGGDPNILQDLEEMASQGQSFFYAAGDNGAYPTTTSTGDAGQIFMTVCGGSELTTSNSLWVSDTVWHPSAGGILINVPIPFYQEGVSMSANQGSTQWRNVPDVALCGDQIEVIDTAVYTNGSPSVPGQVADLAGTSAAAPLWAGFAALVNQQAAAQGQPPIGFATPAIYDIAQSPLYSSCFHDITVGNNTNAASPNLYYATTGYDLASGWGTPTIYLMNALTVYAGPVFVNFNYTGFIEDGSFVDPYSTLADGVSAVTPGGAIFIETAGSSGETMTISKSMTITAEDGPATIGQ